MRREARKGDSCLCKLALHACHCLVERKRVRCAYTGRSIRSRQRIIVTRIAVTPYQSPGVTLVHITQEVNIGRQHGAIQEDATRPACGCEVRANSWGHVPYHERATEHAGNEGDAKCRACSQGPGRDRTRISYRALIERRVIDAEGILPGVLLARNARQGTAVGLAHI